MSCAFLCLVFNAATASGDTIKIGVLAKRGDQQCLNQWNGTATYLTRKIPGHSFVIIPLGFDEIFPVVEQNGADFILANSSFYVSLEVLTGAQRIATLKNAHSSGTSHNFFASVVFCRSDRTELQRIEDLKTRTFMAVDQRSLGGWHMGWRLLKDHGIDPQKDFEDLFFGGSHDAVVYAVRDGLVDGGTVRSDTIERMILEGKIQMEDFKVLHPHMNCSEDFSFIHSTMHYPEWPMAKFPHTPDQLAEQVAIALMEMPADDPAALSSQCAGWTIPQNYRPVHECLMALSLSPYENYGQVPLKDVLRQYGPWLFGILVLSLLIIFFLISSSRLRGKLEQSQKIREERGRARDLLQNVLDSMPSGVVIVDSETRTIREINPAAAKMIGLSAEDIIGKHCLKFFCPEKDGLCPILDLGKPFDNTEHTLLSEISGKVPILKTVVPIILEGREHLLESFFDISERKLAEAERERLMMAIEQVKESIVITDIKGDIQFVNKAFETNTGYSTKEAIGSNVRILKSDKHDDSLYREMWDILLKGETWIGKLINKKKDGSFFTEEVTISPVRNYSGITVNYVAVKRDITEEIRLEEQYRQAQKMDSIGRLAGGVAHDLNNMLGVILGYAEMALEEVDPSLALHSDLNEIKHASQRSSDLTQKLLTFARKQTITPKVLDLNSTLSSMLKMVERLIGDGIELDWVPESKLWPVKIDPTQVDQILVNLCVNSRDAIEDVGKIIIETKNVIFDESYRLEHTEVVLGEFVQLSVSDDGCGMDRETMKNIYEPFFTTKELGQGTGLGLATVYGIVKQNNGFINVYSEVGQGTTFRIYIPRSAEARDKAGKQETAKSSTRGLETILLVEDEPSLLKLTSTMLQKQGYNLLTAATPNEAIRIVENSESTIDLLLTDVVMPQMNGRDLAKILLGQQPDLNTLFMSGYTSNVIAHHGVLDEGVDFLAKPFVMNELGAKIREILDRD